MTIAICGGPKTGKTTMAVDIRRARQRGKVLNTDSVMHLDWSEASQAVTSSFQVIISM